MRTVYRTDNISQGKPWFKGSDKFWVKFSSKVSVEVAKAKEYRDGSVFLMRRVYDFEEGGMFFEYQFEYRRFGEVISRQEMKKMIEYNQDFENLLK